MNAIDLIARLRDKGIRISASDGELKLDAPRGVLDDKLRGEIVAHKRELLRLLSWSRRSVQATSVLLEPVSRDQPLPLSWAQQRLWFLNQLEPGNAAYNISWTVRLKGELQRETLQLAFGDLVARHETLRTVFPDHAGSPGLTIKSATPVQLPVEDLTSAGEERLRARLAELAGYSFDLASGPLMRPVLIRLGESEHILLVVVHHIIADGASMRILFRELAAFYEARLEGVVPQLPELEVQYADFAMWQRRWLDSGEIERQSEYWQGQLEALPPLLELPSDRPRAAAMRYRGASVLRLLPADLAGDLRRISREHGCTLFMTMLAAFYVLLMRYSGRADLAVGTPLGGRSRTSLEGLIGFFINTVVLRADLSGDPGFSTLLHRVREVALQAHANQDLPFEKLVELIQPQRELSYSPVFQVMFDLQEEPRWKLPVSNLEVIPEVVFSSRTASFDLTLSIRQAEQGLDAMFEYDTDLFDEHSIEAMAERYQVLLESIVLDAGQALSELPLTDPQAQKKLAHDWNAARHPYPDTSTIADLFEQQAAANPDALAVVDARQRLSYAQLNAAANRVAVELRAAGIVPDAPVAVCMRRGAAAFAAIIGVHKAGGCVVPLDPAYPQERLGFMLQDCGAELVLYEAGEADGDNHRQSFTGFHPELVHLTVEIEDNIDVAAYPANLPPAAGAKNLAYLMYTSGTSGMPKGAELEHSGLVNYITQLTRQTGLNKSDRVLQFASLSFDIAIEESLAAFLNGAALILREQSMSQSLEDFVAGCDRHEITWLSLPTAWWHELCEGLERNDIVLPASLRSVVIGGEKAELQSLRKWQRHTSRIQLFNTYGPTEASIVAAWAEIGDLDTALCADIPIGMPVPNVRVWVMDAAMQPVPEGLPGELCIAGPGVARGYRNQPELTAARFVRASLPDGTTDTLYRTGDRARYIRDQGLVFLGRNDAQLKLRGHRIEPGEIEAALLSIEGVGRCAVVLHGQSPAARLVAYVTGEADTNQLRRKLAAQLPDYMVPAAIIAIRALPFTANGKLDRSALPEPPALHSAASSYVAPAGSVEQRLAEIWGELLGVEQPGRHDDFFELGGHSLIATRVMARVRDEFDSAVPLRALFDNPSIAGLASAIADAGRDSDLLLVRRPATTTLPPVSWPQQRLLMLDKLQPENTAYNLYSVAELTGELDVGVLQAAANRVIQRHEILRTCFAQHGGEPVQIIQPSLKLQIQQHLIVEDSTVEEQLQVLIDEPFDLQKGPLFRMHLLQAAPGKDARPRQYLLLLLHHIVADGWSVQVLLRELQAHYGAACEGRMAALRELPVQYADFACWQREALATGKLDAAEKYWSEQLHDAPPLCGLPPDYERPKVQSYNGSWASRDIEADLSSSLQTLANRHSVSLFMVLLTAFKALLLRHTGRTDLVVGTPVAGRTQMNLEPLIGCFLNTLVLRTRCAQSTSFTGLLEEVRRTTLDAYEHQLLPFERLLEVLQPPRSAAYTPLFQILFNFHNERADMPGLPGVDIKPLMLSRAAAKFDISVSVTETARGLTTGFEYNRDLYSAATIEAFLDDYLLMLNAMGADPEQSVCEVALTAAKESGQATVRSGSFDPADYTSIGQRFEEIAARYPRNTALVSDGHSCTYAELAQRVAGIAADIQQSLRGVSAESTPLVALLLGQDARMPAVLLGALQAGCAYVPLDRAAPAARNRKILHAAGIRLIVSDVENYAAALELSGEDCEVLRVADEYAESPTHVVAEAAGSSTNPLAYVLFTSGSTGEPKGVMQSHPNVLKHVAVYADSVELSADDNLSLIPAYGFDAAVMDIYGALLMGACLHVVDMAVPRAAGETEELLQQMSVLHMTPSVFRFLMSERNSVQPLPARVLVLGGEEAGFGDFELFNKHFLPGARFVNGLGPTESTMALQFVASQGAFLRGREVPVGRPVPGCEVKLTGEQGEVAGIEGELVICSNSVSPGYLNQPKLSAEKMRPADDGRTFYFTGDCVRRRPDGQFVYTGRKDDQLKIRGQRVEPGDIESALSIQPQVERCAVVTRGNSLQAFYCGSARPDELRQALRTLLPAYMVPGQFARIEKFPLKPNGKVDRAALAACEHLDSVDDTVMPPRSDTERELAAVWGELLNVDGPGVHDDFFAMGGHSLLAMRMLARVHDRYGVRLNLRDFFAAATISQLAQSIDELDRKESMHMPLLQARTADEVIPPLSWAQQRLWFLDRLEPENAAYNLHWAAHLNGVPDIDRLQFALRELQHRHESLRTCFSEHTGEPVQLIQLEAGIEVRHEVLTGADTEGLRNRLLERVRQPFDLRQAPLLRVYVLELSSAESVLLLVMHHIVTDGWSMGVLFNELSAIYKARGQKKLPVLPRLEVQYADYAIWQQRYLSGSELHRQQAYWKEKLADLPPLLELPLDRPRPPVQRFRGAWANRKIGKDVMNKVRQLAESESVTVFMIMLAAFKVLLMRHTGRTDIVVGAPVAGRNRPEVEHLIGYFLNTLVLRTELDSEASFRQVLAAVRTTTLQAYDHQELPFEKLLELLQPSRSTAHSPLVQVTINLHNEPAGRMELDNLQAEVINLDRGTSKFDLALALVESREGLQAGIEYNTDLFDAETMDVLLRHFGELLTEFTSNPDAVVSAPVLSARESTVLSLPAFTAMPATVLQESLVERFDKMVQRYPDRPAINIAGECLSYRRLGFLANAVANSLVTFRADSGVGSGHGLKQRTGILLGHDAQAVIAMLGVLKAGQAYVPLDKNSPPARLQAVIDSAELTALVSDDAHIALLPDAARKSLPVVKVSTTGDVAETGPELRISPDELAYILFTSGSTGEPKGVMQSHRNVMHHARVYTNALHISSRDHLTLLAAFGFDAAVMDIFGALLNGACLHPMELRSEEYPGQLLDRMSAEGVTLLHATPTVFRHLMRSKVCRHELDAVRAVVLGGEEAHASDFDLFRRQFAPPAVFVNGLGPSESTTAVQFFASHDTRLPGGMVPVGNPVADTELLLLDANGKPTGLSGELAISSDHLALGYWKLSELTRRQFSQSANGRRMYRTGDKVRRLPDGQLLFLGRLDSQLKLRGIRIEPAEIEAALTTIPGVKSAAVILHEDARSSLTRLAGYYCGSADKKDIRTALKIVLPDFMVPAALVRVDAIPLTANGKLDKMQLPQPNWERDAGHIFVAPRTATEKQLSAIWEDVLGVQKISVHDDFFELGGHSLLAAQLAARVNESMQVVVPLRRLFDSPTVAQIAEHIEMLQWAMREAGQ